MRHFRVIAVGLCCLVGILQLRNYALPQQRTQTEIHRPLELRKETPPVQNRTVQTLFDSGFCIAPNVVQATLSEHERITLVLHISSDRLKPADILEQVNNWQGPVSLAVAFPDETSFNESNARCVINMLRYLQDTNAEARKRLSVHFLSRSSTEECAEIMTQYVENSNTTETPKVTECPSKPQNLTKGQIAQLMISYPVNKARNTARKFSRTKYILSADMDHMFSQNFETKMISLAKDLLEKEPKTVLVYRIFEVSNRATHYPKTKEELLELSLDGTAQEFHKYYGAHNIPKLYQWFKHADMGDSTAVQFYRPYTSHHWEPQFVSLTSIPLHDETFYYPLRDNTCLRWEMCRAGYKFAIIHDVFMYHRGYKGNQDYATGNLARRMVHRRGNYALRAFNRRMDEKYPSTKHSCPKYDQL